jgi:hypothetical protein
LNAPDRSLIGDGGIDSATDSRVDTGDAGDGDTGDGTDACSRAEVCTGGEDEDCDTLIDCADPDCASLDQCCMGGTEESVPWTGDELANYWAPLPSGGLNYPRTNGGLIVEFPAEVQGILRNDCVPLATGYRLTTAFERVETTCPQGSGCFASLVITPAPGAPMGARLPDDLAVTIDETGRIEVTNSGRSIGSAPDLAIEGQTIYVTITVTVGPDGDGGESSLLGAVTIRPGGGSPIELVAGFAFAPIRHLIRGEADCEEVGGLRVGVEGLGTQFEVSPLIREPLECINAGRFVPPSAVDGNQRLTAATTGARMVSLGWGPPIPESSWCSGGLGSPALGVQLVDTNIAWHVAGDATNYDRTQDPVAAELGFAIGFSRSAPGNWGSWDSYASDEPKVGPCNPACVTVAPMLCGSPSCPSMGAPNDSVRDPSFGVLPIPGTVPRPTRVAYARRIGPDAYGIAIEDSFLARDVPDAVEDAVILPSAVPPARETGMPCESLRDPVLVPVDADPTADERGEWLFYSCYFGLETAEIHAIRLTQLLAPETETHRVIVDRRSNGAWAGFSVWSPELVVEYEPPGGMGRHLYRLWFLAKSSGDYATSIGLLQGQLSPEQSLDGELPTFAPFGANPVLTEGPGTFDDCPLCTIEGLAVVRVPNSQRIRFLIARQDNTGRPEDWHYAPFEQFWTSPWTEAPP